MKLMMTLLFLMISHQSIGEALPEGWFVTGSNPSGYDAAVVMDEGDNPPVATLKSNEKSDDIKFGTVMQTFFPKDYLGKRVEMTVLIKSEDVENWSGAWLRIDKASAKTVAFDNMQDRAIKGTTDWAKYSIVLDVPEDAVSMNYGVLLAGKGQLWFDDFTFEEVSDAVEVTDVYQKKAAKDKPLNNSF